MKQFLRKLWKNEKGAEVVEWIVVAAVLVGIAGVTYALLEGTVNDAIEGIEGRVSDALSK